MDPSIPSYTRGNKTYYDTAGLLFSEGMKVSFAAGWEGAGVFNSETMDCPKWVEQQVLARRRREERELQRDISKDEEKARQEDLFRPRRMSRLPSGSMAPETSLAISPSWTCEYCQMQNCGKDDVCIHCGAPR